MSAKWLPMSLAPTEQFVLLYCAEDRSVWFARRLRDLWYGVDEMGLTREGHAAGDPNYVTGWEVNGWMPLPDIPDSVTEPLPETQKTL